MEGQHFLDGIGDFGSYDETPAPDEWAMAETIWTSSDSRLVGDGSPYSALRGTGLVGVSTPISTDRVLRGGVSPPPPFNESVTLYSPKGSQAQDPVEVIRDPLQTRSLSFNNTDNKLIVSPNVSMLEPQYMKTTRTENGFCEGRNFLNNDIDLDAAVRFFL